MKTITLTGDKSVLDIARRVAEEQQVSRDVVLNEWLDRFLAAQRVKNYDQLMDHLKCVIAGREFTREEMNERQ